MEEWILEPPRRLQRYEVIREVVEALIRGQAGCPWATLHHMSRTDPWPVPGYYASPVLTVQLPHAHPVLVGQTEAQRVAHGALVVGLHDRVHGCHMTQADGMAELMDSHGEQVHPMSIWRNRE